MSAGARGQKTVPESKAPVLRATSGWWSVTDRWDAVPAPWFPVGVPSRMCLKVCPDDRNPWACTRSVEHPGRHLARVDVSGDVAAVVAAWPGAVPPSEQDLYDVPAEAGVPRRALARRSGPERYAWLTRRQQRALRVTSTMTARLAGAVALRGREPGQLKVCGACDGQGVQFVPDLSPGLLRLREASARLAPPPGVARLGVPLQDLGPVPGRNLGPITRPWPQPRVGDLGQSFPDHWWVADDYDGEPAVWQVMPDGERGLVVRREDCTGPLWDRMTSVLCDRGYCRACTSVPCTEHDGSDDAAAGGRL